MYNNIIFTGGIHGVGKSTICKDICVKLDMEYLSASEILKWKDIKVDYKSKNVENIIYTQNRLILGLKNLIKSEKKYILDGHLCLFNNLNKINKIPVETFLEINPILLCIILGDPDEISEKLKKRDGINYDTNLLNLMQIEEKLYGKYIAQILNIPYLEISNMESNVLEYTILNLNLHESTS